jgi:hypothetical protein
MLVESDMEASLLLRSISVLHIWAIRMPKLREESSWG